MSEETAAEKIEAEKVTTEVPIKTEEKNEVIEEEEIPDGSIEDLYETEFILTDVRKRKTKVETDDKEKGDLLERKARLLKLSGDIIAAVASVDEARELDKADRYINNKTTKYLLRAGEEEKVRKLEERTTTTSSEATSICRSLSSN